MRRNVKVKRLSSVTMIRKSALTASAVARRGYPAWNDDSSDRAVVFSAVAATPRVRDALVLRAVARGKSAKLKVPSDASGAR